jgi:hypothetical protein
MSGNLRRSGLEPASGALSHFLSLGAGEGFRLPMMDAVQGPAGLPEKES